MRTFSLAAALTYIVLATASLADTTRFQVLGDWGSGTSSQKKVAESMGKDCNANGCDFVITVGDNFYPVGVASVFDPQWTTKFLNVYESLKLVFYPSLGNHDYGLNPEAQVAYTKQSLLWVLPARYHRFTRGLVDFFVLDTERFDNTQLAWLKAELATAHSPWTIVYGHHPIFSYGQHGGTPQLVKKLLPLLKNRADIYISGHDHDKQFIKDPASGFPTLVCGTGHETRPVQNGPGTAFSASTLGVCRVEADETALTVKILDVSGLSEFETSIAPRPFPLR